MDFNSLVNANQGSVFMLVLTRKYQEKIRIGDNITITVLRTKGKAVRLGIEAPADVPVIRGELSFEVAPAESNDATPLARSDNSETVKRTAPRHNAAPAWATDSPRPPHPRTRDLQRPQVQLKRVPRGEVADYLPKLVAGAAPLRPMMEQR
jgi:carbon storage regulator CsrA